MKTARGVITVVPINDSTDRMAIQIDGVVTYVGSPQECQRRLDIMHGNRPDPSARDRLLGRAIRYS